MICFAEFTVQFHGLEFETGEQLAEFESKIVEALKAIHPNLRFDEDVVVDLDTTAGEYYTDANSALQ